MLFLGLIPSLVQFVEEYVEQNFRVHSCEAEICENDDDDDTKTTLDDAKETEDQIPIEENSTLNIEEEQSQSESEVQTSNVELNVEAESTDQNAASIFDIQEVDLDDKSKDEKDDSNVETVEERIREMKQFRVNSPSYQAVQVSLPISHF